MDEQENSTNDWEISSRDENLGENVIVTFQENIRRFKNEWERQRRIATIQLVCYIVEMICMMELFYCSNYVDPGLRNSSVDSETIRNQLINRMSVDEKCRDVIRMSPFAFVKLCDLLRQSGHLKDNKNSIIEEQVAKFLYVISHCAKNRLISFFFRRSGETSRHFHEVLRAIISLEDTFLRQPDGEKIPDEILNNFRFYPYFKVFITTNIIHIIDLIGIFS